MILAGSGTDCEISRPIEADAWMHVCGLLQCPVRNGGGATHRPAEESKRRKTAFPCMPRERFPSASTVRADLRERPSAQRFPGGLLTRKRTEVQLLPRPPYLPSAGICWLGGPTGKRDWWKSRVQRRESTYQEEAWMLDSPEDVCVGQTRSEYPATSVPFSNCLTKGVLSSVRLPSMKEPPGRPTAVPDVVQNHRAATWQATRRSVGRRSGPGGPPAGPGRGRRRRQWRGRRGCRRPSSGRGRPPTSRGRRRRQW
jgi:hypothetical protein